MCMCICTLNEEFQTKPGGSFMDFQSQDETKEVVDKPVVSVAQMGCGSMSQSDNENLITVMNGSGSNEQVDWQKNQPPRHHV